MSSVAGCVVVCKGRGGGVGWGGGSSYVLCSRLCSCVRGFGIFLCPLSWCVVVRGFGIFLCPVSWCVVVSGDLGSSYVLCLGV